MLEYCGAGRWSLFSHGVGASAKPNPARRNEPHNPPLGRGAEEALMTEKIDMLTAVNSLVRSLIALAVLALLFGGGWLIYSKFFAEKWEHQETAKDLIETRAELAARDKELAAAKTAASQARGQLQQVRTDLAAREATITTQKTALEKQLRQIEEQTEKLLQNAKTIKDQKTEIARQDVEINRLNDDLEKAQLAMRLLKVDRRLATVTVLDQYAEPESGEMFTKVEFAEVDASGRPIDKPKTFTLKGNEVRIDCWVVKFMDKYIEDANDPLRATSLCLFKSIYGRHQLAKDGFLLENKGDRPKAYAAGSRITEFEKKIWGDFWSIANDSERAEQLGIRAAHGQSLFMEVKKNKRYKIELRSSDGLTLKETEDVMPKAPRKAA